MRKEEWRVAWLLVAAIAMSVGCGNKADRKDVGAGYEMDSISAICYDVTDDALSWADSVMAEMTLEELAGQLFLPAVYSDNSAGALKAIAAYASDCHIGGVVLLKGTVDAARTISDTLRSLSKAPPFIAIDAEWGLAMRLKNTPEFPKNGKITPKAEETLLFDYGAEVARECRNAGVNMVLGPVLDVLPDGDRGEAARVIGNRSFGSDPKRVARLGTAYARGLESGRVLSVAKHFPGHGSADADSHRRLPKVDKDRLALDSTDLLPFRMYVDAGLGGVMTGHLLVDALDSAGNPASVSEKMMRGLLRNEWDFGGLIITDAMNMEGARGKTGADAVMAGADLVLAPESTRSEAALLAESVRKGRFPLSEVRERVRRVLFYKYLFALGRDEVADSGEDDSRRLRKELE